MRAVVVYESVFGNTHHVAEKIGEGLAGAFEVTVVPVSEATAALVGSADLLVVGGPTHVHGVSSTRSRAAGREMAPGKGLTIDEAGTERGLREWFADLPASPGRASAAFDTRIDASVAFTGRASKGIARRLRRLGWRELVPPESFLVDKQNHLVEGEAERAVRWGTDVAAGLVTA